jgi:hypothetical protein
MTTLTQDEIQKFWIRVYLGTTNDKELIGAAIDRAYRDFNRTMHGIQEKQTVETKKFLCNFMLSVVENLTSKQFGCQVEFDYWHKVKCDELIETFVEFPAFKISYGQAQKWINMTLKYLFALGDNIVNGISTNYIYYHIPIDNIIQDKLLEKYGIPKFSERWSRIDDYERYLNYQIKVRQIIQNQIPMDVELRLFNE